MTNFILYPLAGITLLAIKFASVWPWVITIIFSSSMWLIFGSIKVKKAKHELKECERKSLELEALLYHARENEKRFREEAGSRNAFYTELLAKLNHQIRTPMNGVTGMSTMLLQTSLSSEQSGYVQSIRSCSSDLMTALNEIFNTAGVGVRNAPDAEVRETVTAPSISINKLSPEFASLYPLKILVAEDDPMNQQMAVMILKRLGYNADVAPNGQEVLELVSDKNYDLILMDVQMPELDGLEATRMIRLCLAEQPVIIAMTANAMDGDRETCIAAGMNDYVSKPVHIEALVGKLEHWSGKVKTA